MQVPELLRVRLQADTSVNLGGVIVQLRASTGVKNPYFILFPKTDAKGETALSGSDFVGQFKDHWQSGLMDYQGGPEDAASLVQVSLFDPRPLRRDRKQAMAWPLLRHELTQWSTRKAAYAYTTSCRNDEFEADPLEVDLHTTTDIVLPVRPK